MTANFEFPRDAQVAKKSSNLSALCFSNCTIELFSQSRYDQSRCWRKQSHASWFVLDRARRWESLQWKLKFSGSEIEIPVEHVRVRNHAWSRDIDRHREQCETLSRESCLTFSSRSLGNVHHRSHWQELILGQFVPPICGNHTTPELYNTSSHLFSKGTIAPGATKFLDSPIKRAGNKILRVCRPGLTHQLSLFKVPCLLVKTRAKLQNAKPKQRLETLHERANRLPAGCVEKTKTPGDGTRKMVQGHEPRICVSRASVRNTKFRQINARPRKTEIYRAQSMELTFPFLTQTLSIPLRNAKIRLRLDLIPRLEIVISALRGFPQSVVFLNPLAREGAYTLLLPLVLAVIFGSLDLAVSVA
ncbi:hypothetical protein WN51_08118 [Melipona quadrifasciata]|uniref:Uncharacterized protein n=1 Tax=Melipona quadrifasciata TaxID=166423 RepID=A0A0M8ZNC5_9HYME|nr:hypothetical protein WN51_08118 [Melipona quadrifasciata]